MYYFIYPVIVGFFAIAVAAVGIRGTSIGQHIGAAFFIGGSTMLATGFIMDYFQSNFAGGIVFGAILSILATWLVSYLLVGLIYVADEQQSSKMATIVTVLFGAGILIFIWIKT